jgi:hypothetical protein
MTSLSENIIPGKKKKKGSIHLHMKMKQGAVRRGDGYKDAGYARGKMSKIAEKTRTLIIQARLSPPSMLEPVGLPV